MSLFLLVTGLSHDLNSGCFVFSVKLFVFMCVYTVIVLLPCKYNTMPFSYITL